MAETGGSEPTVASNEDRGTGTADPPASIRSLIALRWWNRSSCQNPRPTMTAASMVISRPSPIQRGDLRNPYTLTDSTPRPQDAPNCAVCVVGGVKLSTGVPASPSLNRPDTALIGLFELPSPAKWNGLSGSAMKLAAARPGVMPTNQADRVSSVVPVLPPTGRPTAA